MKKLLFLSVLLLASCNKHDAVVGNQIENPVSEHHIPLNEALEHLDIVLGEMNMETKSSGIVRQYTYDSIETISKDELFANTKSAAIEGLDVDDMMYVVNFEDNLGSAILSADDRTGDVVLCVTEAGELNVQDFIAANESMLNNIYSKSEDKEENDDVPMLDLGPMTVPALILSGVIQNIENYDSSDEKVRTRVLSNAIKYGPFVKTKWIQSFLIGSETPLFNRYTPNNYSAGCVVIAVAQIFMSVRNFSFTCTDGHLCYRDTMLTVANYKDPYSGGTEEAQIQAGKFVYNLGINELFCDVVYDKDGTKSNINKAKQTFENFLFNNVEKHTGFGNSNQSKATAQIRNGKPVFMKGLNKGSLKKGHAWILDGEWGDYYHINWGWNGVYDGYFAKGVFDPQGERAGTDDVIDSNTELSGTKETVKPYTWTFKILTYDL